MSHKVAARMGQVKMGQVKMKKPPPLVVDEIRSRNREDIYDLLRHLGFQAGSGSWAEAEAGAELIFPGAIPDGGVYHRQLGWIAEFIGVGFDHA